MKTLLDGNAAAAWGARLAGVQVVPNFPVTPQTEMIETFAGWKVSGEWKGEFVPVESEHSVMSAAIASAATGARTFTGTSSQGLLLMHEMMYVASGMRIPVVMVNVSRGLSAPITLWPDHGDVLDCGQAGWIIFMCERNQEVLDTVIQAYRVCENPDVLLPAIVNMEGFILSYTREPVDVPAAARVRRFLPAYRPAARLDPRKPMALGVGVMREYPYFRGQAFAAHRNALRVIEEVQREWANTFGRRYQMVESFMMEGARACLVTMGANSTIAKAAVRALRQQGHKIGLLRIRVYRPFPEERLKGMLSGMDAVGVVDQNLSPGAGGMLYPQVRSCLYGRKTPVSGLIIGLGGRHASMQEFEDFGRKVLDSVDRGEGQVWWQDVAP
jgi:pyruvate ferredoxin oxidoreductase alpha subunit